MPEPTLLQMLRAAERELRMRRRVYPAWVRSEKITQARAEHEVACMAGIVDLLRKLLEESYGQGELFPPKEARDA